MLSSLAVMSVIELAPRWAPTHDLWFKIFGTEIFWPWYTLIGAVVTIGVASLLRRLLKQEKVSEA
jgi:hypothetical protein